MQSGKAQFFFPFSYCHRDSAVSLEPGYLPGVSIPGQWLGAGRTRAVPKVSSFVRSLSLPRSCFLFHDALPAVRWSGKAC